MYISIGELFLTEDNRLSIKFNEDVDLVALINKNPPNTKTALEGRLSLLDFGCDSCIYHKHTYSALRISKQTLLYWHRNTRTNILNVSFKEYLINKDVLKKFKVDFDTRFSGTIRVKLQNIDDVNLFADGLVLQKINKQSQNRETVK